MMTFFLAMTTYGMQVMTHGREWFEDHKGPYPHTVEHDAETAPSPNVIVGGKYGEFIYARDGNKTLWGFKSKADLDRFKKIHLSGN